MVDINRLKQNDILSEISHYKVTKINGRTIELFHQESGEAVEIGPDYVRKFINTGDEVNEVIEVGKEDKFWTAKQIMDEAFPGFENAKPGEVRLKGIRTIWEEIHSPHVFTVCFKKADTNKTNKALEAEISSITDSFVKEIEKVKNAKKGVTEASIKFVENLVKNPILPYVEGEERVLRGYKIQFTSRDGKYNCIDMDIEGDNNVRPVNILTIKYLIYNGIKYIVK